MLKAFGFATLVVLAIGCKDVTKDIEGFAEKTCACKDKACADKSIDDFVVFLNANKSASADKDRTNAATEKMVTCAASAGASMAEILDKIKSISE